MIKKFFKTLFYKNSNDSNYSANQNTTHNHTSTDIPLKDVLPVEQQIFLEAISQSIAERYNDNFYFDIIKPAIKQLIRLRDDTAKGLCYFEEMLTDETYVNDGTSYSAQILQDVVSTIDDILLSYDVLPYRCETDIFDPKRQRVVKTLIAETPEQAKVVAESRSEGYERRGIIISKELVYVYISPPQINNNNANRGSDAT